LQALFNNAGKGALVPLEHMPPGMLADTLAVNLTGAIALTQAMLPALRAGARKGRVVNMGSLAGTVALPLFSAYSITKFGLEAVSDMLRAELQPQGIKVVLVKAGPVDTPIWGKTLAATRAVRASLTAEQEARYAQLYDAMERLAEESARTGIPAADVAQVVADALTVDKPKARYLLPTSSAVTMHARRLLPDEVWDSVMMGSLGAKSEGGL